MSNLGNHNLKKNNYFYSVTINASCNIKPTSCRPIKLSFNRLQKHTFYLVFKLPVINASKNVQHKQSSIYPFQVSVAHSILMGSGSYKNVNTRHRIPEIRNVALYETVMQAWAKQVRCSFSTDIL